MKLEGWEKLVTIVSSDMRQWNAPEKADILVCRRSWTKFQWKIILTFNYDLHFWKLYRVFCLFDNLRSANCWVLLVTMSSHLSVLMELRGFWRKMESQFHHRKYLFHKDVLLFICYNQLARSVGSINYIVLMYSTHHPNGPSLVSGLQFIGMLICY